MIRRGFWLVLGAGLGVTGYRRATKLARGMVPGRRELDRAGPAVLRALTGRGAAAFSGPLGGRAPQGRAAGFLQDVRDGRAEYLDRHPVRRGPTLEGQHVRRPHPDETGAPRAYPGINYVKDGR